MQNQHYHSKAKAALETLERIIQEGNTPETAIQNPAFTTDMLQELISTTHKKLMEVQAPEMRAQFDTDADFQFYSNSVNAFLQGLMQERQKRQYNR